ncbi:MULTISPECIES: septum site-determining protein Ssd [unclassified Crossiella]|uniref:septum site-determining protein Ssd n=1 Tax=unclassified Crossiella TaxID=2620835 RepID=UPI001FFF6CE9|nr:MULTISPECIES: septum site-determining protein Ssd [unclassified Crossiella]MCK2237670.1 CpaE-like family protein [Crossiella sp. S99.2]MCK2254956.1 CpaE-like family protein [Crossiella sp. S99.1]
MPETRPLVMVNEDTLLDEVLRVAAATGRDVECVPDLTAARQRWARAPLVVLDDDGLAQCANAGMPRRNGIYVLCRTDPPPEIWARALAVGAEQVSCLAEAEPWLSAALAKAEEVEDEPDGRVIAVLGGRGGAGASVFATALALTAADRGSPAMLLDCDPLGGGLELVLGGEKREGVRWSGITVNRGNLGSATLRNALPSFGRNQLTVLSCDDDTTELEPQAVDQVLDAGRRGGGTVVCDLPRHFNQPCRTVLDAADLAVLVVPAEVRACTAAARIAERTKERGTPLAMVVRGPAPTGLSVRDVEAAVRLPALVTMRPFSGLEAALDTGGLPNRPRGPLARAARRVLDRADDGRD